jgi:hypothetical protein
LRATEQSGERFHYCIVFCIDVDPQVRPCREEVLKEWDRGDAIDPSLGNLGPSELRDQTGSVGHTIKIVVVEGDDDAIGCDMGVGLDVVETKFDGSREGFE